MSKKLPKEFNNMDFTKFTVRESAQDHSWDKVFEHYGLPFTSGRDLWDFLKNNYEAPKKKRYTAPKPNVISQRFTCDPKKDVQDG